MALEGAADLAAMEGAMKKTDILDLADRRMNRLSGGEFHRVLIARALAQEPHILLLDEPTAYLDIRHQADFFNLLQSLNGEQVLTVIAVTHDINLASLYCNRIALLKEGKSGHQPSALSDGKIIGPSGTPVMIDCHPETEVPG